MAKHRGGLAEKTGGVALQIDVITKSAGIPRYFKYLNSIQVRESSVALGVVRKVDPRVNSGKVYRLHTVEVRSSRREVPFLRVYLLWVYLSCVRATLLVCLSPIAVRYGLLGLYMHQS